MEDYMGTIQLKNVYCKNCYKCIRNCPVQAISVKNDHAQVIEDGCVFCGKCLQICPQNAKRVENCVDKVKGYINKKLKVYASIAPSLVAAFNIKYPGSIHSVFEKLGFTYVEETAAGAAMVSGEYKKLIEHSEMKNIITTACPSVTLLIEKHYPRLIDQLAPVVSPMVAHGKMLKELYGSRIKVVFIGPCLSKKEEFKDTQNKKAIDAVITFEELEQWMKEAGVSFDGKGSEELDFKPQIINTRYYPAPGGIIKSIGNFKSNKYKTMIVDGIDRCIDTLDAISEGNIKGYFIEMSSCAHSCLGGPCLNSDTRNFLEMREKLIDYVKVSSLKNDCLEYNIHTKVNLLRKFYDKSSHYIEPEESAILEALSKIGKFTKSDEYNCGACGYSSCREKAIAVINGRADAYMCVPFMRGKAESISNVIMHSTPNAIFALSKDFTIQEANMTAHKMFNLAWEETQNKSIFNLIDCQDIKEVSNTNENIINKKYRYENFNLTVEQSILYVKELQMIILIMKDITMEEEKKMKDHEAQRETAEIAQRAIDKQIRMAHEIACLLGETTAETKAALSKLKNAIQSDMGEEK